MSKFSFSNAICLTFSSAKYGHTAEAPYAMWHETSCESLISPEIDINEAFSLIPESIKK